MILEPSACLNATYHEPFPIRFSSLRARAGVIEVLRDDLIPGGTKQRALRPFLQKLKLNGIRSVTYASPFSGFAQIALSLACADVGMACALFAEEDPHCPGSPHFATRQAAAAGATFELATTLTHAEQLASRWEVCDSSRLQLPLGLDCAEYRAHLRIVVTEVVKTFLRTRACSLKRCWVSLGSGTLSTVLRSVLPQNIEINCIDVHVLNSRDARIERLRSLPNVHVLSAPEAFNEKSKTSPPIPSNLHYDAKVWHFVEQHAEPGDLWWNVAR